MIDMTLAELLTGLDLSDAEEFADTIILHSAGKLVRTDGRLQADASFRERLLSAGVDDANVQTAIGRELDAIGALYGLIRDGYFYEASEISAKKPE